MGAGLSDQPTCPACHGAGTVELPQRDDMTERDCPVCQPWPFGFPGESTTHQGERWFIIEPAAPGVAAKWIGWPEVGPCPECEGSGWVRLLGSNDMDEPSGSEPAQEGEHNVTPCLVCGGGRHRPVVVPDGPEPFSSMEDSIVTPNAGLFRQVIAHIRAHPESWDQSSYTYVGSCGTTHCLAGWAAMFAHPEINPAVADVHQLAAEALGLDAAVADQLFVETSYVDDIDELEAIVTEVTGVTFP